MSCPICGKRPPKRFCPARGEKICAICCGQEREVTIDCAPDCSYLIAAHRYEAEHRKLVSSGDVAYRDVFVAVDFVYEHWPVVGGIAATVLNLQREHRDMRDSDAIAAVEALAETYRTLGTGIYYERPPELPVALSLYSAIGHFLQEFRKSESARAGFVTLKDSDMFHILIFLLRLAKQETTSRPRSQAFLDFLRQRFPLPAQPEREAPRIIVP
ncbi:MAG: hypothetical protein KGL75_04765 [Acidobacteriota bacterium]|nr:hypothetical protein [Acidobacteriota bacterium]